MPTTDKQSRELAPGDVVVIPSPVPTDEDLHLQVDRVSALTENRVEIVWSDGQTTSIAATAVWPVRLPVLTTAAA